MAVCDVCGNDYDKTFEIRAEGRTHTFDSFECAIQALAPTCGHCGCRVIGHGVERTDGFSAAPTAPVRRARRSSAIACSRDRGTVFGNAPAGEAKTARR
jgi:hypothetical protein